MNSTLLHFFLKYKFLIMKCSISLFYSLFFLVIILSFNRFIPPFSFCLYFSNFSNSHSFVFYFIFSVLFGFSLFFFFIADYFPFIFRSTFSYQWFWFGNIFCKSSTGFKPKFGVRILPIDWMWWSRPRWSC